MRQKAVSIQLTTYPAAEKVVRSPISPLPRKGPIREAISVTFNAFTGVL